MNDMDKIHEIFMRIKEVEKKKGVEFCYNVDHGFETEYEALIKYFYYDRLRWCGCGVPEDAKKAVRDFLDAYKDFDNRERKLNEYFGVQSVYDSPLLLCLAYTLDAAEFTEHGTSIGGAWLTEDGEDYLYCLEIEDQMEE